MADLSWSGPMSRTVQRIISANAIALPLCGSGREFKVNTAPIDHSGKFPGVAAFRDGSFVVIWFACCTNEGIVGQRYNAAGARVGGEFNVLAAHEGLIAPAIAALKNGGFVAVGLVEGLVRARRFNANGSPAGGAFRVNSLSDFHGEFVRAAPLADGGFVFTWDGNLDNRSALSVGSTMPTADDGAANSRSMPAPKVSSEFFVRCRASQRRFRGHLVQYQHASNCEGNLRPAFHSIGFIAPASSYGSCRSASLSPSASAPACAPPR